MPREDVYCPACPDPETAFRLEDVGVKLLSENLDPNGGGLHIRMARPAWEPVMLDHLRSRLDDDEHRRLYDLCVTELMAAGMTAEELAQNEVQAATDSARHLLDETLRRRH
jgi:hypothetical protein